MTDALDPVRANFADGWAPWISCGDGWHPIIVRLHAALIALRPELRYIQIKEKYAELRVYTTCSADPEVSALIRAAGEESARTCEVCGAAGTTKARRGWYRVLCADHAEGYDDV